MDELQSSVLHAKEPCSPKCQRPIIDSLLKLLDKDNSMVGARSDSCRLSVHLST